MSGSGIRAGSYDKSVTIQSYTTAADSVGELIKTWTTLEAGVPARVRYLTGLELIRAQRITSEARITVDLRYRTDVTPRNRLQWLGGINTLLNIHAVIPDELRVEIHCLCSEVL